MEDSVILSKKINQYYIDTSWDYKYLWSSKANALHFGYYDDTTTDHEAALIRMNEVIADKAGIKPGEKVVDAGCGVGGSSLWLAKIKDCFVIGVNIVDVQIEQARLNADKENLTDKVNFIKADYGNTPLENNSQNVFMAVESMVHAPEKKKIVEEAYRVLGDGGRIIISEYMLKKSDLTQDERLYLSPWLDGWSMPSLETASSYEKHMREAGFREIKTYDISKNIEPSLRRLRLLCWAALPGAMTMESLGLFTHERVANIKASLRQISAFYKGYWQHVIIVGTK